MPPFYHRVLLVAVFCASAASFTPAQAGFLDKAKGMLDTLQSPEGSTSTTSPMGLSTTDIIAGLKEALRVGTDKVISQVGKPDGYLADSAIHIPLPKNLQPVQNALDKIGFGSLTADVETRINRAAEEAAPEAKAVFVQSISEMTLDDAKKILDGSNTAATDYFRQHMTAPLTEKFTPIVNASLAEVGAVKAYDQMMGKYATLPFMPDVKSELTAHTVTKALDGLFHYIATEEAAIRETPAARTTDILKKVFGS